MTPWNWTKAAVTPPGHGKSDETGTECQSFQERSAREPEQRAGQLRVPQLERKRQPFGPTLLALTKSPSVVKYMVGVAPLKPVLSGRTNPLCHNGDGNAQGTCREAAEPWLWGAAEGEIEPGDKTMSSRAIPE